jgi:hypothetical protein
VGGAQATSDGIALTTTTRANEKSERCIEVMGAPASTR